MILRFKKENRNPYRSQPNVRISESGFSDNRDCHIAIGPEIKMASAGVGLATEPTTALRINSISFEIILRPA